MRPTREIGGVVRALLHRVQVLAVHGAGLDVGEALGPGGGRGVDEDVLGDVRREHPPGRPHPAGRHQALAAGSGRDVQDAVAGPHLGHVEHDLGRLAEPPLDRRAPGRPGVGRLLPLLAGRPLERHGSNVVAMVHLRPGDRLMPAPSRASVIAASRATVNRGPGGTRRCVDGPSGSAEDPRVLRARLFDGMSVEIDGRPAAADRLLARPRAAGVHAPQPGAAPASPAGGPLLAGRDGRERPGVAAQRALGAPPGARRGGGAAYLVADRRTAGIAADLPRDVDAERFGALVGSDDPATSRRRRARRPAPCCPTSPTSGRSPPRTRRASGWSRRWSGSATPPSAPATCPAATAWARPRRPRPAAGARPPRPHPPPGHAGPPRRRALAAYRRCRAALAAELGIAALGRDARARGGARGARRGARPGAGGGRAPAGALLGRDAELGALRRAWDGARAGRGGVAVLTGDAGIGKTRLAEELAAHAAAARRPPRHGRRPGAGGRAAVRGVVRGARRPRRGRARAARRRGLAGRAGAAVPGGRGRVGAAAPGSRRRARPGARPALRGGRRARRVGRARRAAPARAGGPAPRGRRRARAAGLRRAPPPAMDALVLVTRRSAVVNAGLEVALDGLRRRERSGPTSRSGRSPRRALRRLAAAAAPGLARRRPGPCGAPGGGQPPARDGGGPLPARRRRPRRGPAGGRARAARAAPGGGAPGDRPLAVAGRPLEPAELALPVGAEALPDAIAAGAAAGLLGSGDERRVAFRHALIREACAAELPPGRRAWVHGALAAALAARPRPAPPRSPATSAGPATRRAPAGSWTAAAAAARALGALDEAARYLDEAVALEEAGPAPAELLLALAAVEAWRGRREASDAAFARAEAALDATRDARGLAEALVPGAAGCGPRCACRGRPSPRTARPRPDRRRGARRPGAHRARPRRVGVVRGDRGRPGARGGAGRGRRGGARDGRRSRPRRRAGAARGPRGSRGAGGWPRRRRATPTPPRSRERAGRRDLAHVAWANAASAAACRGDFGRALAWPTPCPATARATPAPCSPRSSRRPGPTPSPGWAAATRPRWRRRPPPR